MNRFMEAIKQMKVFWSQPAGEEVVLLKEFKVIYGLFMVFKYDRS